MELAKSARIDSLSLSFAAIGKSRADVRRTFDGWVLGFMASCRASAKEGGCVRVLSRLERRFGRYAIANLMVYIVGAQGIVFLLSRTPQGARFISNLRFDSTLSAQGEIWRLISFVLIPPSFSIWVFFILYFYYLLGTRLEEE